MNSTSTARRTLGAIIDIVIWLIIYGVVTILFGHRDVVHNTINSVDQYGHSGISTNTMVYYSLNIWLQTLLMLFGLAYYTFLEWRFGATVGKLIVGVRVRRIDGDRIKLSQAIVRNLLRIIDGFPYIVPYLVGIIFISTNVYRQRVGDKLARTIVVVAKSIPKGSKSDLAGTSDLNAPTAI